MKNIEVLNLVESLNSNAEELKKLKGAKFAYCIIKNIEALNSEAKIIQSIHTISDKYKEYDSKRIEICEKYADRDDNGEIIKNYITEKSFEYKLDLSNQEFINEMESLAREYNDTLVESNEKTLEYNRFLMSESGINFTKIDIDSIPNDISVELLAIIRPFIID